MPLVSFAGPSAGTPADGVSVNSAAKSAFSNVGSFNSPLPTSVTTEISTEHAVPLLHSASPPSSGPVRQQSMDVESLFSVGSRSASREYLASQYSRSRSRLLPSRLGREYWMKDENATVCFACGRRFTTFRRKHHCRVCGQIFCSACTDLIDAERCGSEAGRRVRCCKACEDALQASSDDEIEASFLEEPAPITSSPSSPVSNNSEAQFDDTLLARSFLGSQPRSRSHTLHTLHAFAHTHSHTHEVTPDQALARFPNSASVELNNAARMYLLFFLEQLLKDSELDPAEWRSVLTPPLMEVAAGIHLELNDRLSPREWVKIKRIPGGAPHDISCICGTVFTHSLSRRTMPLRLVRPRIMLITFPLEYARAERYMSLEPVAQQEKEYLRKLVARIVALKPTLLLSCSHVSGRAMDMLEQAGVSVAQNVREQALMRLARITKTDILGSIDRLSTGPQLGSCERFEQRSYRSSNCVKTFFFFFVSKEDPGRCALVRGDPEISSVLKVVLEVMAEICYSLKAETALMRDQLVNVPNITDTEPLILSSSPFVAYGVPYLQHHMHFLEDRVVELGETKEETEDERYIRSSNLELTRTQWLGAVRLWEAAEASHPFMFNPSSHQNLIVLYSLVCDDTATPCVGPEQQLIEFYLSTDQTLGRFVENSITTVDEPCPDGCEHNMHSHSKKYINGTGMITTSVEPMPCKVLGLEDIILMWSYCKVCQQSMPIAPMSSTTWKYSMGKYLELSLYGEPLRMRASTCSHNVYRDHIRYFGWHGYALKIEYSAIEMYELSPPPSQMRYNPDLEVKLKHDTFASWKSRLDRFWQSLLDSLAKVKVEGLEQDMIDLSQTKLVELREKAESDWKSCSEVLNKLYVESEPNDCLALNKVLDFYQQLVDQWHADITEFDGQFFPTERDIRRVTAMHLRGLLGDDPTEKRKVEISPSCSIEEDGASNEEAKPEVPKIADENIPNLTEPSTPSKSGELDQGSPSVNVKSRFGNNISLSMPGLSQGLSRASEGTNKVAILAKHFEELSREFELERQREKQRLLDRQHAVQLRNAHPVAEVFEDLSDTVEDWPKQAWPKQSFSPKRKASSSSQVTQDAGKEQEPSEQIKPITNTATEQDAVTANADENIELSPELASELAPKVEDTDEIRKVEPVKTSLIRTLANFWSERSSTRWNGIEYVLNTTEHYFSNSDVVLRETEPSSLISFCLSLPDYKSRINEFYQSTPGVPQSKPFENNVDNSVLEQAMLRQTGTHMRYYLDRNSVKASCKIFFSEQFDALRRKCLITENYIQSLSRCSTWDSTGGKSGSAFLKTSDDRFILKELSHVEFDSFVTFAPSYFEYMAQALFHDLPTVLAKIFGVYQIIIRNSQKSQPIKMYVLVMENLFYGRKFSKFFDLKGSMRNRKVTETGKENEVLLDENMVEYIYETPVFVREHSKRMLRSSLYNDTLFLTKMNVMDYSLVIGLDEENNNIVAGIIDYIRTYTWDKKIESWVKARAATSNIKEPTVVSPKQYKGRFRESMERYFVMVPDCWTQQMN